MPTQRRPLLPPSVGRTYIMGIINLTPDSFSGDGVDGDVEAAVAITRRLEAEGADLIDVGAESSRPGAEDLSPADELRRLLPAFCAIRHATNLPLSVDTHHSAVAEEALRAGADAINDIWGLRRDPRMAGVVARSGAWLVAMHNQRGRAFHDVISDIRAGFAATLELAEAAGIDRKRIILDPGFGFGWKPEHNLEMIRRLPELTDFGLPLLVGASRKSTLGYVLDAEPQDRFEGTAAAVALAIAGGASVVRVHEVAEMRRVARVADAIVRANWTRKP